MHVGFELLSDLPELPVLLYMFLVSWSMLDLDRDP